MEYESKLQNLLNNVEKSDIPGINKEKINSFVDDLKARNKSPNTMIKYVYPLFQMNKLRWIKKDFNELTKEELKQVVARVNENKSWSPSTKKNFRLTLKVFYRWLEGVDEPRFYPERVRWITANIPKRDERELSFDDMITRDEIIRMAQCALNPMHKAFVWLCYESTGRPEENLNINYSDITFDNKGAIVSLRGTKDKRQCRLVSSVEPLRNWLRNHPLQKENDYPLWVTCFSKKTGNNTTWTTSNIKDNKKKGTTWVRLGNVGGNKILKVLAERAGIKKDVCMYSLRKGRITELGKSPNLSGPMLKSIVGWSQTSRVADRYIKFSFTELDGAVLGSNGFEDVKKNKVEAFIECKWCGVKSSPGSLYCENVKCGKPLIITDSEVESLRKEMTELIEQRLQKASVIQDKMLEAKWFDDAYRKRLGEMGYKKMS